MKWIVKKLSEPEQIYAKADETGVKITMKPERYACVECVSGIYDCEENSVYNITSDIPTEDMKCKMIANWYLGDKVVARRYVNGNGETISPKGVDRFSVSVLVNGKEERDICFSGFSLGKTAPCPKNTSLESMKN